MLRVNNTLSGQREFHLTEGEVRFYFVDQQWDTVISAIFARPLHRHSALLFEIQLQVTHVMNITDVDDRIMPNPRKLACQIEITPQNHRCSMGRL